MTATDLQRWTREVAEDPGAPAFVRLARAYRRQGRSEAAREVVLRGLERNPEHLDGHSLLALIHVEEGDRERAQDEWQTVLRLDPRNFDASRGLGFLSLERNDLAEARRHLETAAGARPDDPTVSQALQVLRRREAARQAAPASDGAPAEPRRDPARIFDALAADTPFLGALLLDAQGLVQAGSLGGGSGVSDMLGALLDSVVDEALRTTGLIRLGDWKGMLLECEEAMLHLAPLPPSGVVLVAAHRDAPPGWVVRTAERAGELASRFMGTGR